MAIPRYQTTKPNALVRNDNLPPADDPYFYGWREVLVVVNGEKEWVREPLTFDDVLHPQLGDYIVQNDLHTKKCVYLLDALMLYFSHEPDTVVLYDAPIDWEVPGIKAMGPDIAVIRGVQHRPETSTFYVKQSGGHVDLVVEVTSPSTWEADMDIADATKPNKFLKYAWVGVPCYVTIDEVNRPAGQAPPIRAYTIGAGGRYEPIDPDERGWFWLDSVELWIGPYQDTIAWYTPDGTRLLSHVEEGKARQREAEARRVAEEKAHYEAEARQREAEARQRETEARQRAEERIRELEAQLRKAGIEQ